MTPLTESDIRSSFVNATRREVAQATMPDLDAVRWDRLEYLGWRDRKAPLQAYVVAVVDAAVVGIMLRVADRGTGPRRRAMCAWCEDVVETENVTLLTARRAGAPGRKGDSIGILACTEFTCSANVRRTPTSIEAGSLDPDTAAAITQGRIEGLIERSTRFLREVASTR